MSLTPLHDRILVKPSEPEEVSSGGIIIPDTAKEKPQQGEIVAVGKGRVTDDGQTVPLQLKAGDVVLYGKYSGTEVAVDGGKGIVGAIDNRDADQLASQMEGELDRIDAAFDQELLVPFDVDQLVTDQEPAFHLVAVVELDPFRCHAGPCQADVQCVVAAA